MLTVDMNGTGSALRWRRNTVHSVPCFQAFGVSMQIRTLVIALCLVAAPVAFAQQPSSQVQRAAPRPQTTQAPALTPQQQAALTKQNSDMTKAAQQVIGLVDANRTGEVWDGASTVMKGSVTRDEFVKQLNIERNRLGAAQTRGQAAVTRSQFPAGAQVPQGFYINVATPTKFANAPQPVRELVSFRLDEDKVWRVSGYSLR